MTLILMLNNKPKMLCQYIKRVKQLQSNLQNKTKKNKTANKITIINNSWSYYYRNR